MHEHFLAQEEGAVRRSHDAIEHVISFDLPNVPETYVHRIGRTARADAEGIALSMCDVEERPYLVDIERLMKPMSIASTITPSPPPSPRHPSPTWRLPNAAPSQNRTVVAAPPGAEATRGGRARDARRGAGSRGGRSGRPR
ncbi:MAG TPA: hypothetical protein ENK57_00595 [Polyangiaceae bacterium]|nr:hypothetical protein [Polyangiaceae bacterium]